MTRKTKIYCFMSITNLISMICLWVCALVCMLRGEVDLGCYCCIAFLIAYLACSMSTDRWKVLVDRQVELRERSRKE